MVASSFVSYVGPFNREFRELLLARDFVGACARMRIPATPDLKVSGFLAEEAEVGEWVIQARFAMKFSLAVAACSCPAIPEYIPVMCP